MVTGLRRALLVGACCGGRLRGRAAAFLSAPRRSSPGGTTALHRNSPGFVGFAGDDGGGGGGGWEAGGYGGYGGRGGYDRVADRPGDLAPRPRRYVDADPRRGFDVPARRVSRRPRGPPREATWWDPSPSGDRLQGGSRRTYRDGGTTFLETDGRPLDAEVEVYNGPNDTPTRVRMFSEDGRARPMHVLTDPYGRGTVSVRNRGPMEFPLSGGSYAPPRDGYGGGYDDPYGAYGAPRGGMSSTPFLPPRSRGETVQGGALRTFSLDEYVEAVQVTITSDGLPVNAKVELWGTGTQVKQLAEVYNDDGDARPFAAILDLPGGYNTVAVRNTGPIEYPIRVVVEPVAGGGGGNGYGREGERYGDPYGAPYGDMYAAPDFAPPYGRGLPRHGARFGGPYLPPL